MEKIKINVAELLLTCKKGMELDCTICEDVYFDYVSEFNIIHCYIQYETYRTSITFNQYGAINSNIKSKCVIFPKGKTTWEGFQRPFKDGDIVYICDEYSDATFTYVAIFKQIENGGHIYSHCFYNYETAEFSTDDYLYDIYRIRFATEEEKQKLFDAIKANGYEWNSKTKTLEKFSKFKNGDVIVWENHWGPFISIFKKNVTERNGFIGHCVLDVDDNEFKIKDSASYFNEVRFATKREKEQLFRAIERNGYKWNPETKTLEKLTPDKFDINTLKPFESRVLIRDHKLQKWSPAIWGFYDSDSKDYQYKLVGVIARYCIPYEGNEHLLGTTNNCDEYFKTWK